MKGVVLEMARPAPKLKRTLDPVIAVHKDVMFGERKFDLATWSAMTDEERAWIIAGMRNALVFEVDERYPSHIISFPQPRPEVSTGLELVEGVLSKAVTVKVHAFVFAPVDAADEQVKEARAGFLTWMWKAINTFARKGPEDALADAWAMGFRPREPERDSEN